MAKRGHDGLSIADLRRILATRQNDMKRLAKERAGLQKQIDKVDAQIAQLGGSAGGTGGGGGRTRRRGGGTRARNKVSLVATLEGVLKENGKPMAIGDILQGVLATGYRSSSPNFRAIVNQTLIKEKKLFGSAARGVYQMKK